MFTLLQGGKRASRCHSDQQFLGNLGTFLGSYDYRARSNQTRALRPALRNLVLGGMTSGIASTLLDV
jgi:hypothetical protein